MYQFQWGITLSPGFTKNIVFTPMRFLKRNQGNHGYSGNQKNVIQGQRPDIENRHTQQRT